MERITVIPRVEGRERSPILFLPDDPVAHLGRIACYTHLGHHSEVSMEYYRRYTKPAEPRECDALLHEYVGIQPKPATLRIRKKRA